MSSVFGDITWRDASPPQGRMSAVALFGDVDIDLSGGAVPASGVGITAIAPFGDIDVLVPAGVNVDVGGFTLFGSKRVSAPPAVGSGEAPLVRLRAYSIFGSVKVRATGS